MSEIENPRQSARLKKMPPPESVGDGLQAKEKQSGPSARGRKIQKPRKDSEAEGVEADAFTSSKKTNGDGIHTLQQGILVEAAASYTPSRSSGRSPSKKSGSPSKSSRTLNKRERMHYLIVSSNGFTRQD